MPICKIVLLVILAVLMSCVKANTKSDPDITVNFHQKNENKENEINSTLLDEAIQKGSDIGRSKHSLENYTEKKIEISGVLTEKYPQKENIFLRNLITLTKGGGENKAVIKKGMSTVIADIPEYGCYVVTNDHLVNGQKEFLVSPWKSLPNADGIDWLHASLLISDKDRDLALLRIPLPEGFKCDVAEIHGETPEIDHIGRFVETYGFPFENHGLKSYGYLLGFQFIENGHLHILSDFFSSKGFSGGGVYLNDGALIGINVGVSEVIPSGMSHALSYIIPARIINDFLDEYIEQINHTK